MTEHPTVDEIQGFVMGTLDSTAEHDLVSHVSACAACAARVTREARVEHALLELPSFRRGETLDVLRSSYRTVLRFALPAVALAAAAALLFLVRRESRDEVEVVPDPVVAVAVATPGAARDARDTRDARDMPKEDAPRVPDADAVVAKLRPRFRQCYEEGLAADAKLAGKVILAASVATDGSVESATAAASEGLSSSVVSCLVSVVRSAQFSAPAKRATLSIPVTFVQKAR